MSERAAPAMVEVAADPGSQTLIVEEFTLDRLLHHLEANRSRTPAFDTLLKRYRVPKPFPDMTDFRIGPKLDDKILMDWIILTEQSAAGAHSRLLAHGITTRIRWSGAASDLPRGWQGAVRRSYERSFIQTTPPADTLVGLFITVEDEFRSQGWAARVLMEMKALAARAGLQRLVIPLRLPTRYAREYAEMPFTEFATLKRPDGEYLDHWLRLHVRLGGRIVGTSTTSHQHAMHIADFEQQFGVSVPANGGAMLVQHNGEWFRAAVEPALECAVINEGCVWVEHVPTQGAATPVLPAATFSGNWLSRLRGRLRWPAALRKREEPPPDSIYPLW